MYASGTRCRSRPVTHANRSTTINPRSSALERVQSSRGLVNCGVQALAAPPSKLAVRRRDGLSVPASANLSLPHGPGARVDVRADALSLALQNT